MDKTQAYILTAQQLLAGDKEAARSTLQKELPFEAVVPVKRSYSLNQKMRIFVRDGFIDRYTGDRLVNPGYLRVLSLLFPAEFPYHPHWRMEFSHLAFWDCMPTIDHVVPVARGGADVESNWVTTSMRSNQIKANWLLEELRWQLLPSGDVQKWCGLSAEFIHIVDSEPLLMEIKYISDWYRVTRTVLSEQ